MPVFSIVDLNGKEFSVSANSGKIIYVNFWATWCAPCLEEFPRIEREIWEKYKTSENFAMMVINREESLDIILPFKEKYKYAFPQAADLNRKAYKLFGERGMPRSYVVGTDGKILFQSVGYNPTEFSRMVKIIDDAINEAAKKKSDEAKAALPKV